MILASRYLAAGFARILARCLLFALVLCGPLARADDYGFRNDYGSDYNGPNWDDDSANPITHHVGPPGPGDNAGIAGGAVTCSGGAVDTLTLVSGSNFQLSGSFTATTFNEVDGTLSGGGTMTVQNIAGVGVDVEGANLIAGTSSASATVNGGSLSISNYSSQSPGGLLIVNASAGGQVQIGSSLTNFNGTAGSGAGISIPGIADGMDNTLNCNGAGSTMDIANDVSIKAGFLDVKDGGVLKVGGNLLLDGGTDFSGNHIGGGGGFSGANTLVSVGGTLTIGDSAPAPGFSLGMDSGAKVNANGASIGDQAGGYGIMTMDGVGTVWNIVNRLGVGGDGTGELDLTNGAQLLFAGGSGQLFAIGLGEGSDGTLTADGSGTIIDARTTAASVGANSGAKGNVTLTNGATLLTGYHFSVGDSGEGALNINSGSVVQTPAGMTLEVGSEAGSNGYVADLSPNGLMALGTVIVGNQGTGAMYVSGAGNSARVSGNFFVGGDGGKLAASTGNGLVRVGAGAQLSVVQDRSSIVGLGNGSGSVGEIEVTDSGSALTLTGDTTVGVNGVGELAAVNGATAQSAVLDIASSPNSRGTLIVYNNGTVWTNTGYIFDGGTPGTAGGKGAIVVNDGGLLRVYKKLYLAKYGLASVTATLTGDPNFPNPPPTAGSISNGRIFVGSDNFGPDGAIRVGMGGVLAGKGQQVGTSVRRANVVGKVVVGLGGKFQPGGDPGVFSINGDLDLSDGGKGGGETDIEVAGTGRAGTNYDQIIASGRVTLGGTLRLVLLEGYIPKAGDTIEPVKAKTTTGNFKEVVTPGLTLGTELTAGKLSVKVMSVADVSAPMITSDKTAIANVGEAFSYQIAATGMPAGYAAPGLPAGLDVDPGTGLISGIPTAPGDFRVRITSTSVGGTGDKTLDLTVAGQGDAAPVITVSAPSVTAPPAVNFSYQISASNTPTSYGATGLPAGLNLNGSTGLISGSPAKAGTYLVMLTATNAFGTGAAALKVTVELPDVKVMATVPQTQVGGGMPGEFTLSIPAPLKAPLKVNYALGGTAENGADYVRLTGSTKIKVGKTNGVIKVKPIGDLHGAFFKTVKLTLEKGTGYTIGKMIHGKVKILAGQ